MQTLEILAIFAGLLGIAAGGVMFLAGAQSDAPELGDEYGRSGCIVAVVSLVLLVGGILGLVL